jgi:hypothetical protein
MTLSDFQLLNVYEKASALNKYGVFLAERRIAANRIYLYAINYFYLELLHELSSLEVKAVTIYRIFEDSRFLDAYLDKVDISSIYV